MDDNMEYTINTSRTNNLQEKIWYSTPAEAWIEALPVGNGSLGAMVFGGVNKERLALNEETIWGGYPLDRHNPRAPEALSEVRRLLFLGENDKAQQLARETMVSNPKDPFSYQPLCDMTVECMTSHPYKDYIRSLDLTQAETMTKYRRRGYEWRKICFSSYPHQVLVYRIITEDPEGLQLYISLTREQYFTAAYEGDNTLAVRGYGDKNGIQFCAKLLAVAEGDEISPCVNYTSKGKTRLSVVGARVLTLYIAAATTYRFEDPASICQERLNTAVKLGFDALREAHRHDYMSLYGRFMIDLSSSADNIETIAGLDTAERLERIRSGKRDILFSALYMNYHRYLLIGASRAGTLPSTLQGIWNDRLEAPWESDFHSNVNLQINYWAAEAWGLSECHLPLLEWLRDVISKTGAETAKKQYGCDGWVLHHCTDIWGGASPIFDILGIWPMGGAWLCRHLYEHYLYTMDDEFLLKTAFPLVKGAVRFILDFLVEAPPNTACPGKMVTCPSHSPENQFMASDGKYSWFTYACTMDNQIIADLFSITRFMIGELRKTYPDYEHDLDIELIKASSRIPETTINPGTGRIREWIEDYEEYEPGHRHVSHLYACYPGEAIYPQFAPELSRAAEKTLETRLNSNYDGQGWSLGWIACLFARLGKGNRALEILEDIARNHVLYNLMINAHGNPQVGDAQAYPAAMLEMLAQSHGGVIRLLPSLPSAWPTGKISGMHLRGRFILNMEWEDGKLKTALIYSQEGGTLEEESPPVLELPDGYCILERAKGEWLIAPARA